MNEKEKIYSGYLYDANTTELIEERNKCKELCFYYNSCSPTNTSKQAEYINKILGKFGKNIKITAPFWCDYGYNITVGDNFYTNHNCVILDCNKVTIGNNVLIGPNCCLTTASHPINVEQRICGLETALPIVIGNNVWLGANVTVLPGVTIGDNTIIGAESVVTKNIPANVIAVGNPCRVMREITQDDKNNYKFY